LGVLATGTRGEILAIKIAVCVKQVPDPDTPPSAFIIDESTKRVVPPPGTPPVVNGFDLNATEAALLLKDAAGGADVEITIIAVGSEFVMDVVKRPLSMGADELVLVDDPSLENLDAFATARVLAKTIENQGPFDVVLCGRQASDWDNGHVPLVLSEILGLPCISFARNIQITDSGVRVERSLTDGYQVVEAPLPAVVTVTNELGEPRYPTLRGIMAATRKTPTTLSLGDIGVTNEDVAPSLELTRLFVPESERNVEIISGEDEVDAGRQLALRLREENLI
jgi:electron transfer flavoprotein beta subunit